jgi:hypothetical protein
MPIDALHSHSSLHFPARTGAALILNAEAAASVSTYYIYCACGPGDSLTHNH